MSVDEVLLIDESRLQMPSLPNDFVLRSGLVAYLNENIHKSLTVVCAGAGFGKSTLISGWLQQSAHRSAWVSVQADHNDLRFFLSHLIVAVQAEVPGFGTTLLPLLQTLPLPPVEYLAVELKNELGRLSTPFILVLDDLHLVDNSAVFQILHVLLDPPLDTLHLCIISRKELPIPLSRLRSKNRLNEITDQQLRMSRDEMDCFLGEAMNVSDRFWIEERAEGWAAGLRLFKLQFSLGRSLKFSQKDTEPNFFDSFFTEEILSGFGDSCLDALFKISILSQFNSDLVDVLIDSHSKGGCTGFSLIKYLLQENIFVIILGANRQWYRFHHLFHDLLRKEFKKRFTLVEQMELHEKAAYWFGENEMIDEALFHAKIAGKDEWSGRLVATQFHRVLVQDKDHLLEGWLAQIPEEIIQKEPQLQIVRMWVLKDQEAFHLLPEMVEKLERSDSGENIELQAYFHFFRGIVLFWGGFLQQASLNFKKTLTLLPLSKYAGTLGETRVYYVTTMQMLGRGDEVDSDLQKRLLSENLPANYRLKLFGALIFKHILAGNLEMAVHYAFQIKKQSENLFLVAWADYIIGSVYLRQNKLEQAKAYLEKSLVRRYMMDLVSPVDCFSAQLLVLQAQGAEKDFQSVLHQFQEFVRGRNNSHFRNWFFSIQARLALQQQNLAHAEKLFRRVEHLDHSQNFLFWVEDPRITYCRLLLARNTVQSLEEASVLLKGYLQKAQEIHHALLLIEVQLLLAILAKKQGDEVLSVAWLEAALESAKFGGVFYLFLEVAAEIKELLPKVKPSFQSLEFFRAS